MSAIRSLLIILCSTLLISGSAWGVWGGWKYWEGVKASDPQFQIKALMTRSLGKDQWGEAIRPAIVAEWLDLSVDKRKNLYKLNLKEATRKILRQLPVKKARVTRVPPSTLFVEVEMRRPIAFLGERTNIGIDEEGNVFPLVPFYTPKKLPQLFIGPSKNFPLAVSIIKWLQKEEKLGSVEQIDMEKASALSFGEREIVLLTQGTWVRLDPLTWKDGLKKLFKLRHLDAKILDLRIEDLALITKKE